jgi:Ohr subfamily peroxiredoxin
MNILYRATATAKGGRAGHVASSDGVLALDLAMPRELGGDGRRATNPEQLFAAGYSACFDSALNHVARLKKIAVSDTEVSAEVGIGARAEGGFGLAVALSVKVGGVDQATAEALVQAAHAVCPYSNATRGNIEVTLTTTAV